MIAACNMPDVSAWSWAGGRVIPGLLDPGQQTVHLGTDHGALVIFTTTKAGFVTEDDLLPFRVTS